MTPRTRSRLVIVGVFAVFMLPILVALLLNLPGVRWTPFGLRNHGELIQPPPRIDGLAIIAVDGDSLEPPGFEETWTLLVAAPAPCDARCTDTLDKAQRTRLALGEHGGRTRLLWLVTGGSPPATADVQRLAERFPAVRVAVPGGALPPVLAGPLPPADAYVVDPRAYVILRYPPGFEGRGLLKDMERLLRYAEEG